MGSPTAEDAPTCRSVALAGRGHLGRSRESDAGLPVDQKATMDVFIAATANVHELTLVTRNVSDFESAVGDFCVRREIRLRSAL